MASPSSATNGASAACTLVGFAALLVGLWWVLPAAALIVAGVLLMAAGARLGSV